MPIISNIVTAIKDMIPGGAPPPPTADLLAISDTEDLAISATEDLLIRS